MPNSKKTTTSVCASMIDVIYQYQSYIKTKYSEKSLEQNGVKLRATLLKVSPQENNTDK
ncbi:MAG: hypothetical protein WCJ62_13205 [Flavobacterium sp.]